MCSGGTPDIPTPKDTPVNTPEPQPPAPVINEKAPDAETQGTSKDTKRKGTSALRINLSVPGASGNGLNIPNG